MGTYNFYNEDFNEFDRDLDFSSETYKEVFDLEFSKNDRFDEDFEEIFD